MVFRLISKLQILNFTAFFVYVKKQIFTRQIVGAGEMVHKHTTRFHVAENSKNLFLIDARKRKRVSNNITSVYHGMTHLGGGVTLSLCVQARSYFFNKKLVIQKISEFIEIKLFRLQEGGGAFQFQVLFESWKRAVKRSCEMTSNERAKHLGYQTWLFWFKISKFKYKIE